MNLGLSILSVSAGAITISGFLADWNRTHLYNPRWTPHAKYHDGLSILMGAMNGAASLYFLHRKDGNTLFNLKVATLLSAIPYLSMALSYSFPGARGLESEFPELVPRAGKVWLSEWLAPAIGLPLLLTGYIIERNKMD